MQTRMLGNLNMTTRFLELKLMNIHPCFSIYHSVLIFSASVLDIGRISTNHAVLLSSTSVIAISKAPNTLLSADYLSFSPSNR